MIIAIKDKDKVVVGYSNLDVWRRLSEKDYVDEENVAIKFSKTGKIFACTDMERRSDILLYDDELLDMDVSPKSIVREVIPYMKQKLKENDIPIDQDGWKNTLTICDNEHIYDIGATFGFREVEDYVCHGYGEADIVLSILDETASLPPEERIVKAIKFANKLFKEDLFPLIITDTKDKQFKIIYKGESENEHFDSV